MARVCSRSIGRGKREESLTLMIFMPTAQAQGGSNWAADIRLRLTAIYAAFFSPKRIRTLV